MPHMLSNWQVIPKMQLKMSCLSISQAKSIPIPTWLKIKSKKHSQVPVLQSQLQSLSLSWLQCTCQQLDDIQGSIYQLIFKKHRPLILLGILISEVQLQLTKKQYIVMMQKEDHEQSLIAEEEHIAISPTPIRAPEIKEIQYRYAGVNQVRSFQRSAEIHNQQLVKDKPLLFWEDQFTSASYELTLAKGYQTFKKNNSTLTGQKKAKIQIGKVTIDIPVTNIKRKNVLKLQLKNFKRKFPIEIYQCENTSDAKSVNYRYIFTMVEINLLIRVLVQLDGQSKVWKQMQVPLPQNRFTIQIQQFNNEQTDIKINNTYTFHLIMKMPYHEQAKYIFFHDNKVQIEKIQFMSRSEVKPIDSSETHCSNNCQLI